MTKFLTVYLTIVSQLPYLESGCFLALLLERWTLLVEVLSTVPSRVCSKGERNKTKQSVFSFRY